MGGGKIWLGRDALVVSLSILILLAVLAFFVSESIPRTQATENINPVQDIVRYETNGNGTCRVQIPGPTILLRMDDVRAFSYPTPVLINETLRRNISISLGVMPADAENDFAMIKYLRSIRNNPLVEIAQHGSLHTTTDINLTEADLLAGKVKIEKLFGASPITYIPPYNTISDSLYSALARNFKIISSRRNVFSNASILEIGQSVQFHVYSNSSPEFPEGDATVESIIAQCRELLQLKGICVLTAHPQEFSSELVGVRDLSPEKFSRYQGILGSLQELNATFRTFHELLDCS
jgi:hypothetical protein